MYIYILKSGVQSYLFLDVFSTEFDEIHIERAKKLLLFRLFTILN